MNMPGDRKNPLWRSFGYAFSGIWTGIRKERNMKVHCMGACFGSDCRNRSEADCGRMVYLHDHVRSRPVVGACQYSRGGGSRSGDRGEEAFGKDRQRYGGRSGSDRCDCSVIVGLLIFVPHVVTWI